MADDDHNGDGREMAAGVQDLISRIRDKGVRAGRDEAKTIVRDAKREAAAITAAANEEAKETLAKARATIESEEQAAMDALRNAARDTVLELRSTVRGQFEAHIRRLVSQETQDSEFIRSMVLVLAGEAADTYIKDKDAKIFVAAAAAGDKKKKKVDDRVKNALLALSGDALREGIELVPATDVRAGARVQLVGENLEIDLTDEAITQMLLDRILPRFRRIIEKES